MYACTDLSRSGQDSIQAYDLRFQIEFLIRDAKQFTGLNDCQCRSQNKLDFHFNAAFAARNVAYLAHQNKDNKSVSLQDIQTQYFNQLLLDRFISTFEIDVNSSINQLKIKKLLLTGSIAA